MSYVHFVAVRAFVRVGVGSFMACRAAKRFARAWLQSQSGQGLALTFSKQMSSGVQGRGDSVSGDGQLGLEGLSEQG
jgi:hypothetical protein